MRKEALKKTNNMKKYEGVKDVTSDSIDTPHHWRPQNKRRWSTTWKKTPALIGITSAKSTVGDQDTGGSSRQFYHTGQNLNIEIDKLHKIEISVVQ